MHQTDKRPYEMAIKKQQGKALSPDERRQQRQAILDVAVDLARDIGYSKITRDQIAQAAGISPALVSDYLGTMPKPRRDVVRRAVVREVLEIVAQAMASRDPHVQKASDELKQRAVALMMSGA